MFRRLTATDVAEMTEMGPLEKLDLPKVKIQKTSSRPSASPTLPISRRTSTAARSSSIIPSLSRMPPTGMDSLWDPKNHGKVGIVDIQHVYTTMAAALVGGGKPGDFDKAKKALLDLQEASAAHLSEQRGDRPGADDRRGRPVHHVEGAGRAVAERRRKYCDGRAEGRRPRLRLGLHDSEKRTEQGRGVRFP